jgi:hypothetical protein
VPLLQTSDSYHVRSAVVQAVMHVLDHLGRRQQQQHRSAGEGDGAQEDTEGVDRNDEDRGGTLVDQTKSRDALLGLLMDRAYDVSSFTRAAVLKSLGHLALGGTLPHRSHLLGVTQLAMDRLRDKTVVVRKQAMQVTVTARSRFGDSELLPAT